MRSEATALGEDLRSTREGRRGSEETENWELEGLLSGKMRIKYWKLFALLGQCHSNEESQLKCLLIPQSGYRFCSTNSMSFKI